MTAHRPESRLTPLLARSDADGCLFVPILTMTLAFAASCGYSAKGCRVLLELATLLDQFKVALSGLEGAAEVAGRINSFGE
jgi:hypothetical protein